MRLNKPKKLIKPKAQKVEQLDYSDCMAYLEKKYKFVADDYAGQFTNYQETLNKALKLTGVDEADLQEDLAGCDQNDPEIKRKLEVRNKVYKKQEEIEPPYLDFWHYLIDAQGITNGCDIYFDNESLKVYDGDGETPKDKDIPEQYRGWKEKIIEYILKEFGKGKNREVTMHVYW